MGEFTSTNEESLIAIIEACPEDHFLNIVPSPNGSVIEVYRVPRRLQDDWPYITPAQRNPYWVCSFMALALFPEVWRGRGDRDTAARFG